MSRRLIAAVPSLILVMLMTAASHPAGVVRAQPAFQQTDWDAVLAGDPHVAAAAGCVPQPPSVAGTLGPCIEVLLQAPVQIDGVGGTRTVTEIKGYARTAGAKDVHYGVLGDGTEAALILVDDGSMTGGNSGVLVYEDTAAGPRMIAAIPGYKLDAQFADGNVVTSTPFYFPFDPNCCNIAFQRTTYTIDGGYLDIASQTYFVYTDDRQQQEISAQELTVRGYFDALNQAVQQRSINPDISDGDFRSAYDFFSPHTRAELSLDAFKAGTADLQTIRVLDTRPGAGADEVEATPELSRAGRPETQTLHVTLKLVPAPGSPTGYLRE